MAGYCFRVKTRLLTDYSLLVCFGTEYTTFATSSQVVRKFAKKPKGSPEGVAKNLRTKMSKNPAQSRRIPKQYTLYSRNTMMFTTISSGVVLTSSRTRPGLVPGISRSSLEKAGKTGRSAGEILDQSATRLGARWEKVLSRPLYGK